VKLLFATLLIHRDVDTFIFNWFCSRINLDNGFSIPHLIVNDGTLTPEDLEKLHRLTNVIVEETPVEVYNNVPKAKYLAKIKLFEKGFMKYDADRVVILDPDVFFYRPWDGDLNNILLHDNTAIMDFGSSLGPNLERYEKLFQVKRDVLTPTCNTGLVSTIRANWPKLQSALITHLSEPFLVMEDQAICFKAFWHDLFYHQGIRLCLNGANTADSLWQWFLQQNGAHLVGMRTRPDEYNKLVNHTLSLLPESIHPSRFEYHEYIVPGGVSNEYGFYNFDHMAAYPSAVNGMYVTDAIYLSGNSSIKWKLPPQIKTFECSVFALDNGNAKAPISINGENVQIGQFAIVKVIGELNIKSQPGDRTFYALTNPKLKFEVIKPTMKFE